MANYYAAWWLDSGWKRNGFGLRFAASVHCAQPRYPWIAEVEI